MAAGFRWKKQIMALVSVGYSLAEAHSLYDFNRQKVSRKSGRRSGTPYHLKEIIRDNYGVLTASEISKLVGISRSAVCGHWMRMRADGILPPSIDWAK